MRKNNVIIFALFTILSLFSCDNEEQPSVDVATGYFSISGISLSCDEELLPLTRAVEATLRLQILQGGTVVKDYAPSEDLSKRIVLPVGDYTLKAFTPEQAEAANNETGYPVYELYSSFVVKEGDITSISLTVPQINIGVSINVSEEFAANFHSYSVTVLSVSGRSVTISDATVGASPLYYFAIPADRKLQYTIVAFNDDEEEMTLTKEITGVDVAKNYSICLDLDR